MATTSNPKAAALVAGLGRVNRRGTGEGRIRQMAEVAAGLGLVASVGTIGLAGREIDGSHQVDFNVTGGDGYGSGWPEWAYEVAFAAALHGRPVYVVSDGPPFGPNLLIVMLYPDLAAG